MSTHSIRTLLAATAAASLHATAQPTAPEAPAVHTLVPKVSLYSEYEYRGIGQTAEKPALQFNLDYSHASGFYLGTFVTNIKWLKELNPSAGADIEWDIFGGYKFEIAKDVLLDLGYLRYEYPSSGAFSPRPNTDEIYVGFASGAFSAKYSHAISNLFGTANSKRSSFVEFNWSQEVMPKLTANAHIGRQTIKHSGALSYTVYKLGLTYDLGGGWSIGGYVKDTNADAVLYTINGKDWGKARLVAFAAKTF